MSTSCTPWWAAPIRAASPSGRPGAFVDGNATAVRLWRAMFAREARKARGLVIAALQARRPSRLRRMPGQQRRIQVARRCARRAADPPAGSDGPVVGPQAGWRRA